MMMNRKIKNILTGILILSLLAAGTTAYAAAFKGEVSVTNDLNTGSVDIDLTTWQEGPEGLAPAEPVANIAANQNISFIPKVTSNRADCYVRVVMDVEMEKDVDSPITTDSIIGLSEDWVQHGNVFYYKNVLNIDESADVYTGIHVPEDWTNKNSSNFKINLVADAIQAENFTPDFNSDAPWGTVEIEESKSEDGTDYRTVNTVKDAYTLVYKGDSTFEVSSEDFFSNFDYMMPGDTCEDKITLKNSCDNYLKLYFKSTAPTDEVLLDEIMLKILVDGKLYYEGPLKASDLNEYEELAMISPNKDKEMTYELQVPEYLQNEFSVEDDNVTWYFKAIEVDEDGNPIKTGDSGNMLPFVLVCIGALIAIIYLLSSRKRENNLND